MDRMIPVIIWMSRVAPSMNPVFQGVEICVGDGRSVRGFICFLTSFI
jgi:hypothetical protein